jgi:hypothetical protein
VKFAQISNLHRVAPDALLHDSDPHEGLWRAVAHIRAHNADAPCAAATDDRTPTGEATGNAWAREILPGLPMSQQVTIGTGTQLALYKLLNFEQEMRSDGSI